MKFGQLLSVVIIAGLVGIASNIGYTYLTTERPNSDQLKFEEFLNKNWEDTLEKSPYSLRCLGTSDSMTKFPVTQWKTFFLTGIMRSMFSTF